MNSLPSTANNETVAYGHILALSAKMKRSDQINLARALCGQLGMIAQFPGQMSAQQASINGKSSIRGDKPKKKGPAKQDPSNPLSGTAEKKAFDAAKKAVTKATKESGGQKLPADHLLIRGLETAKDHYFRALSNSKGKKTEDANASSDEESPPQKWGDASPKSSNGGNGNKTRSPESSGKGVIRRSPKP